MAYLPTDAGVFLKSFLSLFYTLDKKHDLNMPQVHTFMQLFALVLFRSICLFTFSKQIALCQIFAKSFLQYLDT